MAKPDSNLEKIDKSTLPRHVAIIMDGNGRWAVNRHLPRVAGHKNGVNSVRAVVEASAQLGIEALTLFAFSSENWQRPKQEVETLMELFVTSIEKEVPQLHKNQIRLQFIGDRGAFKPKLQKKINEAEMLTQENKGLRLNIAANYGGKWDVLQAVKSIAERIEVGELKAEQITTDMINDYICLNELPELDLFIRTGGEQRVSNFLIWQLAYAELYFTDLLWPDFDTQAYTNALESYAGRQRRFGLTGEQAVKQNNA
ncbi:MAG: isoprenyl transferase [Gammaproteobacteria bacterium]|nr:isoprenyl transferase [Gammaproteobacteria bacterium]MDH5777547.1 isoprenyl transferase [Gammaproteobacteria bacterium]